MRYDHDPQKSEALSDGRVRAILEDEDGRLWIATDGGGLSRLDIDTGTFETLTMNDGLPSNSIYGILPDASGNLWLTTTNGLSRFTPAAGAFRNYDRSDGLQGNDFSSQAYLASSSGKFSSSRNSIGFLHSRT